MADASDIPEKGDQVSWTYGSSNPGGQVAEKKDEGEVAIQSKRGNTITKAAEPDNPAVHVTRPGNDVVKNQNELEVEEKADGGGDGGDEAAATDDAGATAEGDQTQGKDKGEANVDESLKAPNGDTTKEQPKNSLAASKSSKPKKSPNKKSLAPAPAKGRKRKVEDDAPAPAKEDAGAEQPASKKARGRPKKEKADGETAPAAPKEKKAPASEAKKEEEKEKEKEKEKETENPKDAGVEKEKKSRGRPKGSGSAKATSGEKKVGKEPGKKAKEPRAAVNGSVGTRTRSNRK